MATNLERLYSAAVALLGKGGAAASLLLIFMGKYNSGPPSSYRGLSASFNASLESKTALDTPSSCLILRCSVPKERR